MAWTTPKTNWTTDNVIGTTDLNNIGNNLQYLYDTFATLDTFGDSVAAASALTLTKKKHHITGSTDISQIKPSWTVKSGDRILLICQGNSIFRKSTSPPTSGFYRFNMFAEITVGNIPEALEFVFDDKVTIGGVVGAWTFLGWSYISP